MWENSCENTACGRVALASAKVERDTGRAPASDGGRYFLFRRVAGAVPGPAAVPALISALDDADWWVSERAIDALGKSGDERAVGPLAAWAPWIGVYGLCALAAFCAAAAALWLQHCCKSPPEPPDNPDGATE